MLQKIIAPTLLILTILLYSCGPSKKLQSATAEIESLHTANSKLTTQGEDLQKQVASLAASNKTVTEELSHSKTECADTKRKFDALRHVILEITSSLDEVEHRLQMAMADFKDKGVEVHEKDGLVYVNLQDNLLYKSGSSVLSKEGEEALGALAGALNNYPKLKVYVVGNTDDKKFKKGNTDNLSLSTERANGVVRVLRDNYQVDPVRLTAAGKGKYAPVADNTTEEGRARNRRTEIILNPDLMKLWESVLEN
jgi:chemotaxis protein MotB